MSTSLSPTKTALVPIAEFKNRYQLRKNLTVCISGREWRLRGGNTPWEAQVVFMRPDDVHTNYRHDVILWLPVLQQIARLCGHPVVSEVACWHQQLQPEKPGGYPADEPYKVYKVDDCGSHLEVTIIDNERIEVEEQDDDEEVRSVKLVIGDILAVLDMIDVRDFGPQSSEIPLSVLNEVEAFFAASTRGEWQLEENLTNADIVAQSGPDEHHYIAGRLNPADARFVVVAHRFIPQALQQLRGLPTQHAYNVTYAALNKRDDTIREVRRVLRQIDALSADRQDELPEMVAKIKVALESC